MLLRALPGGGTTSRAGSRSGARAGSGSTSTAREPSAISRWLGRAEAMQGTPAAVTSATVIPNASWALAVAKAVAVAREIAALVSIQLPPTACESGTHIIPRFRPTVKP